MRELLLGALGAGLTYAVVWYQVVPAVVSVSEAPQAARRNVRAVDLSSATPHEPQMVRQVSGRGSSGDGALPDKRQRPAVELEPGVGGAFIEPLPTALPKTIERMAELQRFSADPNALAARVQAMETDEADLAELKAFAERFVELPPNRVGRYVPATSLPSSNHERSSARRR